MQHGEGVAERWREILDFERSWWDAGVPKDIAIRQRFRLSPVRYYQALNRAIDIPAALEYDPMLVRRLRRLREERRRTRFGQGPESPLDRPAEWQDGKGR